jgi:hypothetical protein
MAKKQRIQYVRFEAPQKIGLLVAAVVGMGSSGAVGYFMGQLSPRSLDSAYMASEPLTLDASSTMNMPVPSGVFTFNGIFSADDASVDSPPPTTDLPEPPVDDSAEASGTSENAEGAVEVAEMDEVMEPVEEPPVEVAEAEPVTPALRQDPIAAVPSPERAQVAEPALDVPPTRAVSRSAATQDPEGGTQEAGLATAGVVSSTRTVSRGRPRPVGSAVADSQDVVVSRVTSHDDAEAARQALRGASLTATVRRASNGEGFEVVLRTSGSDADRERQEQIGRRVLSEQ